MQMLTSVMAAMLHSKRSWSVLLPLPPILDSRFDSKSVLQPSKWQKSQTGLQKEAQLMIITANIFLPSCWTHSEKMSLERNETSTYIPQSHTYYVFDRDILHDTTRFKGCSHTEEITLNFATDWRSFGGESVEIRFQSYYRQKFCNLDSETVHSLTKR